MYDFNCFSNRLLHADFRDYNDALRKFLNFVKSTPIIYDYIVDCGPSKQDLDKEFQKANESYGRFTFSLGETVEEEVCNIFEILCYISNNDIDITYMVTLGYSSSYDCQEQLQAFNGRVTMIFINNIERYLTKVGIDMGLDEKNTYSITVSHGQVNIANDNATITANNIIDADLMQLADLIDKVKMASTNITGEDAVTLAEGLQFIEEETKSDKPKKSLLKTTLNSLKAIKGTVEFGAALTTLIQFMQPFLN